MELAFRTGDIIYVYGDADEDGFYMGELNGERGLVPSNFLTEAPADFRDPRLQSNRGSSSYSKGIFSFRYTLFSILFLILLLLNESPSHYAFFLF